jgi:hypothetical protein
MPDEEYRSWNIWLRSLVNGVFAWFLGFVVYMIPGFIISIKMGFTLGPQSNDPRMVSAEISQTISEIYQNNFWLSIILIVFTCLFIVWRSRVIIKKYGGNGIRNGMLVSVFSICFALFMIIGSFDWVSIIGILLYSGAGYLSGVLFKPAQ